MKEDTVKKWIQKSTVNTSENFTDKLVLRIETEKATQPLSGFQPIRMYRYAVLALMGTGIVFLGLMYWGLLPKISVLNFQLETHKTPFLIIAILLLLMGANQILKMQHLANFQREINIKTLGQSQ